jgi:DNA-binding NarL/FixJ family response regulator
MIAEGMQMKEIAEALDVTVKSAEHYRQNLRDKLGLHDIAALIRYAMQHNAGRH